MNHDYGQGKTAQEETDDSLTMLVIVTAWALVVIGLIGYFLLR